ncbi:MAG: Amidophosphoribosyltransferase [Candidatus Carbobacillus altaicus]|uniref:Amidophosphoribosyltransferase n=1 Tax=Candidatus Carbonibacillus altaicus TaxID=2163959 RepID=A0A2R6XYJ4_9BACL|nr:MAG: Amidophosphoribosyltransferase [Candidatus Carbobacillus altaicus]
MVRTRDLTGGLFAAVFPDASREEALAMMQHALSGLQHRGQDALGWVMVDATGSLATFTGRGQVSQLLTDDIVRSAAGASHSNDETKGRVVAALAVTQQLKKTGGESAQQAPFVETLSTGEQLVWAWNGHLSVELADWWEERAGEPSERLTGLPGAYALVGLWQDTLFLLRDAHGVKPLFYGRLDGMVLVASETSVLDHLGASDIEGVSPGALVTFSLKPYYERTSDLSGRSTPSGHRGATPALPNRVPLVSAKDSKLCAFEAIYYSRTDARLFDRSVYALRKGMGEKLAEANVPDADVVIGVPDSGTAAAVGYAQKSGYPLEMGLVKNRYVGRTFIQTTQAARERGVRQKLSVIEDVVRHKRVILVDDSIVRGTTARWNVQLLRDAGAREVHLRISAPPVRAACPFDILGTPEEELFVTSILNTAYHINQSKEVHTGSDVLAADALQQLARRLGADSLYFLPLSAFKEVLQNVYCTECFYGRACDSGPSTEQHTPFRTQQRIEQSTQLSSQLDSRQDTQHDTQQDMQLGTQQSTQQSTRLKEAHHARSL